MLKQTFKIIALKTEKETMWWSYAAWTLPFIALLSIILTYFIGVDSWISITMIVITTTFFSVSVFWWWWALNKINTVMKSMHNTNEEFRSLKDDLTKIIKDVREDVSNWEWRKP